MRLRAALADAHGVFLRTDWEYHTARFMRKCMDDRLQFSQRPSPVIQRLRNAATRDSASNSLRCVKWSGSLLMENYEKKPDQISPTW